MRHRMRGRKLGRNASHRKAMFRNMATSLIRSIRAVDEDIENAPKIPGRIITTVPKAKELRPYVEKLITLAKKAMPSEAAAAKLNTSAERNSAEWKTWRESKQWNDWNQAIAPALRYRRRAFDVLRDKEAVDILFSELAERFEERKGGYTRIVQLAEVRLGDSGKQALIEFVGVNDREKQAKRSAPVVADETATEEPVASEETTEDDSTEETPVDETAESAETTEEAADEEEEEK